MKNNRIISVMEQVKLSGELGKCKCGARFWIYWHRDKDLMKKCAPCFFKKG